MEEKPRSVSSPVHGNLLSFSPIKKLGSPRQRGALYDSFELLAITRQLNKAIHGSGTPSSSPPFKFIPNSSFYKHHMNRICKESGGSRRRRISSTYQQPSAMLEKRPSAKEVGPTRGFVARLWNKVRKGLSRNSRGIGKSLD